MSNKELLSISEFARLTGINRANLIFYDKIGLLSPEFRGDNNYRYYTYYQLGSAYLIYAMRDIGLSIDEIKQFSYNRTPQKMIALFDKQEDRVQAKIEKLQQVMGMMKLYSDMSKSCDDIDEEQIEVRHCAAEPIFLSQLIHYSEERSLIEESIAFYDYCTSQGLFLSYPLGTLILQEHLEKREWTKPSHYYFKLPESTKYKPAGLYATGYKRGNYGTGGPLYDRLMDYLNKHNLSIAGNAYEEYPLNEMSTENPENYLIRIAIQVQE